VVTFRGTCLLHRYGTHATRGSMFLTTLPTTSQITRGHTQNNLNFHLYETHKNSMLSTSHTRVGYAPHTRCVCVCDHITHCVITLTLCETQNHTP